MARYIVMAKRCLLLHLRNTGDHITKEAGSSISAVGTNSHIKKLPLLVSTWKIVMST